MAANSAKAVGYLELDISGFTAAMDKATKLLAAFGVSFAAFKTADFWVNHIKGAIDFGNAMYVAGQKLGGFDPGKLFLVQKAFEQTGISAEEANASIAEMLKSHRDFSTLFKNPADYGKALGVAKQNYGPEANALSNNAEKLSQVANVISSIYEKGRGFFVELTGQFVQPLYALLNALNQVDLSGAAEALGGAVDKVADTLIGLFSTGKLTATFALGLEVAAKTFANYLAGAVASFANGIASVITNIKWDQFGQGLWQVLVGAFTKALSVLADGFLNVAKYFGAAIATAMGAAIEKIMPYVDDVFRPIFKALGYSYRETNFKGGSFEENLKSVNDVMQPANDFTKQLGGVGQGMVNEGIGRIKGSLGQFAFNFKPADLFPGLAEETAKLVAGLSSAEKAGAALGKVPDRIKGNLFAGMGPQEPVKVIADSLARVGGGGGYIRTTMSIAEREAMAQTEIQRQLLLATQAVAKNTAAGAPKSGQDPQKINRG